jgi:hypothetical protein
MKKSAGGFFYWTPRIIVLIFSVLIFIFALLSGASEYGDGLDSIIKNSPNALPWLLFFGLVYLGWKNDKIGGYLFVFVGLFSVIFFNTWKHLSSFFVVSFPIFLAGILFLVNYYRGKK